MKYQLKGSTVTFTNRSVNLASVTGWKWYLDSGSGFAEVASTLNADITFPATAGVTCTVKLVAEGPFGSEVKYEEQYMTVENIPGPQLVSKTITKRPFTMIDELMEVQAGTGAGDLTWELIGAETYGLSVNLTNGRLTGPFRHNDITTTKAITLRVTDALGRSHTGDIFLVASALVNQVYWLDVQKANAVIYDSGNNNKVSAIKSALDEGGEAYPNTLRPATQAVAANQPVFNNSGAFSFVEFSDAVIFLNLNNNAALAMAYFLAVVEFYGAVTGPKFMHGFYNNTTFNGYIGQYQGGLACRGYNINSDAPEVIPSGKIIVGILPASVASNGTTTTDRRLVVNGVLRGNFVSTAMCGVSGTVSVVHRLGCDTPFGVNSAKFRLFEYVGWKGVGAIANSTPSNTELNGILRHLGEKYGIPVRTMLSSEIGWTGDY